MVLALKISVVIPAYNEEKRIEATLEGVCSFLKRDKKDFEVIVVFDGSDATPSVVKRFARRNSLERKVRLLVFKRRLGKGGALQQGLASVKGDAVFMIDADYSVPAGEMPKLLDALQENDVAIGSRYLPGSETKISSDRLLASRAFNFFEKLLFFLPFSDTQCGFKAFRKSALEKLLPKVKAKGFVWDVDMLVQARKLGMRVKEVPIRWKMKGGGTITYSNGFAIALKMLAALVKLRLSS